MINHNKKGFVWVKQNKEKCKKKSFLFEAVKQQVTWEHGKTLLYLFLLFFLPSFAFEFKSCVFFLCFQSFIFSLVVECCWIFLKTCQ